MRQHFRPDLVFAPLILAITLTSMVAAAPPRALGAPNELYLSVNSVRRAIDQMKPSEGLRISTHRNGVLTEETVVYPSQGLARQLAYDLARPGLAPPLTVRTPTRDVHTYAHTLSVTSPSPIERYYGGIASLDTTTVLATDQVSDNRVTGKVYVDTAVFDYSATFDGVNGIPAYETYSDGKEVVEVRREILEASLPENVPSVEEVFSAARTRWSDNIDFATALGYVTGVAMPGLVLNAAWVHPFEGYVQLDYGPVEHPGDTVVQIRHWPYGFEGQIALGLGDFIDDIAGDGSQFAYVSAFPRSESIVQVVVIQHEGSVSTDMTTMDIRLALKPLRELPAMAVAAPERFSESYWRISPTS